MYKSLRMRGHSDIAEMSTELVEENIFFSFDGNQTFVFSEDYLKAVEKICDRMDFKYDYSFEDYVLENKDINYNFRVQSSDIKILSILAYSFCLDDMKIKYIRNILFVKFDKSFNRALEIIREQSKEYENDMHIFVNDTEIDLFGTAK